MHKPFLFAFSLILLEMNCSDLCFASPSVKTKPATLDKATTDMYLAKAKSYRAAHDSKSVLKIQEFLLKYYPNEPVFYKIAAECYSALGEDQKAIDYFDKSEALFKTNPKPRFVADKGPFPIYLCKAISYNNLKKYSKALENVNEAIKIDTPHNFPVLYVLRANIFLQIDRFEDAKKDFDTLMKCKLDGFDSYDAAILASRLGLFNDAANLSKKSVAKNPLDPKFLGNCGYFLFETGKDSEAEDFFKRAIASKDCGMNAYSDYSWLEKITGHIDQAEPHAKKAISLYADAKKKKTNELSTLMNGAIAYTVLNQFEDARQQLKLAQQLDPKDREYFRHEGRILKAEGKLDEALEAYNKYLEKGLACRGYSERAAILKKLNRKDEAKKDLERAKEKGYVIADGEIADLDNE
ncbi:tetratricopeptide repeat protein [bacterium]|nr:tetratricopeptide repeat protein [bacterium]QQR57061.1 MAG: tetratricopeptide repeat protein [Candidatus Melainabacteria bacterium]